MENREPLPEIDMHDTVRRLTYRPRRRLLLFRSLSLPQKSATFAMLSRRVQAQLLSTLDFDEAVELLDHLDPRLVHAVLSGLPYDRARNRLLARLKDEVRSKVEYFMQFHPKATSSLLSFNYVLLPESSTIADAASAIEAHWHDTGRFPEVLVHHEGKLIGSVPLNVLVRERNSSKLKDHAQPATTISYQASREEIVDTFTNCAHGKVTVLDSDGSVLGLIYADDVIELLGGTTGTSLYSFAGVSESERPFDAAGSKVGRRWRWLILNLASAFLAAGVVVLFEDALEEIVLLAVYMPVIAGMGGNAATQTLAVMVRGIAIGEIELRNSIPSITREVLAGLANGIIVGALAGFVAWLLNGDALFGVVLAIAMIASLVIAGFFGTLIPLVLKKFGRDPATSATIFITTATDVLGFLVFLGLGAWLLL